MPRKNRNSNSSTRAAFSIHGGNHEDQQLELNGLDVGDAFDLYNVFNANSTTFEEPASARTICCLR